MANVKTLTRRKFLGASAGVAAGAAAAAALGPMATRVLAGTTPKGVGERLVPPGLLGVQQFSIRDAITRRSIANATANNLTPTMGYLGGPNFPEDPTDLGPLVPLPGGFVEVFNYLASLGYRGFEFFQFTQNVNELGRQPTMAEIRGYMDAAGLYGQGTHTAGLGVMFSATANGGAGGLSAGGLTQIANAHILGLPMLGTAGDPTGSAILATVGNTIGWAEAVRRANIVGAACAAEGIKWYWHTEQNAYQGFNATTHPELIGTNRLTYFYANTDPSLVFVEPDTFHGYAGRHRFPFPDGSKFDLYGWWLANYARIKAWHIKDGTRIVPPPVNPTTNPFTQVTLRPPTFAPGGLAPNDSLYEGEGSIGIGYPTDPDPNVVGFKKLFDTVKDKGSRFYIAESDNAIGPAADPGRSLRHAKLAAAYLLGLRNGMKAKPNGAAASGDAQTVGQLSSQLEAEAEAEAEGHEGHED